MSDRQERSLFILAPAKLNLHLEVLGKRPDGYHEIETLLVTISLADRLSFRRGEEETLVACDDDSIGPMENNLVRRAIDLVREESGRDDPLAVELHKRIPAGAGLGGGSSDAASTILGLNQWWSLGWDRERMVELGARLGSDVPFFFYAPAAIARGRGERVTECSIGRPLDFVVVTPRERLSTADVFGQLRFDGQRNSVEPIADALERGDVGEIAARLHNRLQEVSLGLCPPLSEIHLEAATWPCMGHLMTGSGSSYFALCESRSQAESLSRQIEQHGWGSVFVVRSG